MRKLLLLLTTIALAAAGAAIATGATSGRPTSGVAYAGITHSEGKDLYVSGDIKDKILGRGAIVYVTKVTGSDKPGTLKVTAKKVTIFTPAGSLSGSGSALQTISADGKKTTVHDGVVTLNKGTGALKGHTLSATFGGPLKDGVYTFKYKGTYK